jgi:hypothetical protein
MTDMVPCECNECECTRWMDTRDDECDDCFDGKHDAPGKKDLSA